MAQARARSDRRIMVLMVMGLVLSQAGCSGWFGPDAAAEDKANSTGGGLGTGLGALGASKGEAAKGDGAFAPAPAPKPAP